MTIRRKYSAGFKREAVLQTQHPGVSCNQVARELGINPNVLGRWKRELEATQIGLLQDLECHGTRNWPA
jgi:transposase